MPAVALKRIDVVTAVSMIGVLSPLIRSAVLWAFRFESSDVVRAEACRAIALLDLEGDDVVSVLQQRYLVEDRHTIRR